MGVIQIEHLLARRSLDVAAHVPLRSMVLALTGAAAVAPVEAGVACAILALVLTAALYTSAPEGLDTADAELVVFLSLASVGVVITAVGDLVVVSLIGSFAAVYFFAGWNKLRSHTWRRGRAFLEIVEPGSRAGSAVIKLGPSVSLTLAWGVIALQLSAPVAILTEDARLLWFGAVLGFQFSVSLLMGIPSFFLVALSLTPLFIA